MRCRSHSGPRGWVSTAACTTRRHDRRCPCPCPCLSPEPPTAQAYLALTLQVYLALTLTFPLTPPLPLV